ncbi:MAG TPA: hypothetical protein ENJ00_06655 [Phycisphaerales bacterium]|nr:hypothetical protein [Phycisphaerales bacterium]
MKVRKRVALLVALGLGLGCPVAADDGQAQMYLNEALEAFGAGDFSTVRSKCLSAIAASDTEQYRLSAHQVYASTYFADGDYQAVIDYLEPVITGAEPDAESYSELVLCHQTLADAKQMLGDLSGAIAVRTEAIDQYGQFSVATIVGPLYVSNAADCAEIGDYPASRQWFDRLFVEQWEYGANDENRAYNRLLAVQLSGFTPSTPEYTSRIDDLLADQRVEEDRGNALLYAEKYDSVGGLGSPTARAVAEEMFVLTNIYGWHKSAQEQPYPYFRTDEMTYLVQTAIAVVLVPIAISPPESPGNRDMNYQFAKFLLTEMGDEEQVVLFRDRLAKVVREYEISVGNIGSP